MTYFFILLTTFLASCSLYESDAYKLINEKGKISDESIVIQATKLYSQGTCEVFEQTKPNKADKTETLIVESTQSDLNYWAYIDHKMNLRIQAIDQDLNINCIYPLKPKLELEDKYIDQIISQTIVVFREYSSSL